MTETSNPEQAGQRKRRPFFGWYIVAASAATNTILSAAYFQGFGALIIPIEQHFGWPRWVISAAMAMRQLESGIASPFIGMLLDRFGARRIILWSAIIAAIGFFGLAFMTGWVTFFLFFFIVSIGASGASHAVTWPVVIARWFKRNRGRAMGLAVMGPIFGSPIVILNTAIEDMFGWRVVLFAYAVIVLVGVSLLSMVARERPEPYGLRPDGDPPEEGASTERATMESARQAEVGLAMREVLRTKDFWLLTAFFSGMLIVNAGFQIHLFPYFEQDVGLSSAAAGVILTLVFFLSGVGRMGAGYLLDKMDYRIVLAAVGAMMGLAFVYLQLVDIDAVWMTLPFVALFGVGFGSVIPMRGTLGGLMFGTRSLGSALGLLQGGSVGAGMVGPLFLGIMFDLNGNYYAAIWVLVGVSALMVPIGLAMGSPAALAQRASTMTARQ